MNYEEYLNLILSNQNLWYQARTTVNPTRVELNELPNSQPKANASLDREANKPIPMKEVETAW